MRAKLKELEINKVKADAKADELNSYHNEFERLGSMAKLGLWTGAVFFIWGLAYGTGGFKDTRMK
jgi:hypothetical protein